MQVSDSMSKYSRLKKLWDTNKYALLFLAPWIIGILVFSLYPILHSLVLSFTDFDLFSVPRFVELQNYRMLLQDARFIQSCKVTTTYVFLGVPLQLIFALLLALLLNRGIPGLKYFRAIYYLPALLGGSVAISILWRQVFGIEGIFNQFLSYLGFSEEITKISWISNPKFSLHTLIVLRVWQFGSPMIIFLAGLRQIPSELYESASIDGANTFAKFTRITLPILSPIILFNLIMQIISAFTFLPTTNNIVALTFDDGPDPHITPKILDILEEYSITAAFFAIGENVQKYPEVVKRIVNSGHQLANHSWSHQRPTSIAASDLMDDVKKTQKILEEQYTCTRLFRPPYGLVTPEQMQQLTLHGYKAVIWSVDSMDWYTTNALEIQKCVLDKVHPGAIILMHCAGNQRNRQATIQALPGIIQDLKKRGYMFVTPDEILNS
jgi:multiple sugar transport system permease protein